MEEEKFEIITLQANEETGEPEITMYNRNLTYIPTEFQIIVCIYIKNGFHIGSRFLLPKNFLKCIARAFKIIVFEKLNDTLIRK